LFDSTAAATYVCGKRCFCTLFYLAFHAEIERLREGVFNEESVAMMLRTAILCCVNQPDRTLQQPAPHGMRRAGATATEFALVASLFFFLIFGLIELGRGLMVQHLMTNAARQGCRVAVIEGKSSSDVNAAVLNVLSSEGISGDTVNVQVNAAAANASTANYGDEITVIVSIPTSAVSWVPKAQFLIGTISGKYTLRRE
jgi:Flp pilus assembly protein TadG